MDLTFGRRAADAESVREQWRARSSDTVWLRPSDWYHPAVDALTEAVLDGRPTVPAAERLGEARALAGVGIGETIDDATCLFRCLDASVDTSTLRALSTGWVTGTEQAPAATTVRDPASGLATTQYLQARLGETYERARARGGPHATQTHCLVVVDVAVSQVRPWQSAAREAGVGRALLHAAAGRPAAAFGGGRYVLLCTRADATALTEQVRRDIEATAHALGLTAVLRRPPRVWVEPLPSTHRGAELLLDQLAR
ncbi:hypothetical protein CLV28_2232 [Sediminihabitans luteus]|uniref:Uncharacterized protein n=1 Tax=Sediminihabitans luteus TaxID=1138585 RepID=A0A2M9CEU6_9CELL|nr:hypothetical protein [Sediminihabitans luteus]PJJ70397.1 hypothetical protein CLV28_2232 [Sediminihabitans luteus]GII97869.1 hypothetical protein Slu03_02470 [Sediminihabitans luteus]